MEERYIAAADLGSSQTRLTVARINGDDIQIQYYGETASDGIRNSAVFNPKKAAEPLRKLISEAENELNIKILQVVVGLPRCDVRQENNSAKALRAVPDECISETEVEELKAIAQDDYPNIDPEKETLYGAVAQSFDCDDNFQIVENEIVGMVSREFTGNFKLFIGKKSPTKAIDKVFNNLEVAVAKKIFTPDALAKAVLTEDEKESGVALIDFGGGAASVTIYKGKILRHYASIPFGGKTITDDIKNECTISEELAENIKLAYGACMPDRLQTLSEKILQIEGEENMTGPKQIPVKYMSEIITCREQEIIDALLYEIQQSGLADALRSGIVVTGGGARMANLLPFIKECSGYDARVGRPRHLFSMSGCPEANSATAVTSLGMILTAKADPRLNCIDAREDVAPAAEEVPVPEAEEVLEDGPEMQEEQTAEVPGTAATEPAGAEAAAENAEPQEEQPTDLFGQPQEEPAAEKGGWWSRRKKQKPVKEKKQEKQHRGSLLGVQWKHIVDKMEDIYNEAGKEEV